MAIYDIKIDEGNSYKLPIKRTAANGNPISLVSVTSISGNIYPSYEDGTPIAVFSCAVTNASAGMFQVSLSPAQTSNLDASNCVNPGQLQGNLGVYIIDIYESGEQKRILEGKVALKRRPRDRA